MVCRVAIVAPEEEWGRIEKVLAIQADPLALVDGRIECWTWNRASGALSDRGSKTLRNWFDPPDGALLLISRSVNALPVDKLHAAGVTVRLVSSGNFFQNESAVFNLLQQHGVSWMDHARSLHEGYDHRAEHFGVPEWLAQFAEVGAAPYVGPRLLRETILVPTDRCVRILKESFDQCGGDDADHFAVLSRMGKSGAVLSSGLRKALSGEVADLSECLGQCGAGEKVIHVFEDGLWTGIELKLVIDSLLGRAGAGKLKPLVDPQVLRKHRVVLHFAVSTDLGRYAARSILHSEKLDNFELAPHRGIPLDVLSDEAKELFESGKLAFRDVKDFLLPAPHVQPHVIGRLGAILIPRELEQVDYHVRFLGSQLWHRNHAATGSKQPDELSYGANGIGGAVIFRHSSPRANLPVFWASGPIKIGRRVVQWKALFPEGGPSDHTAAQIEEHASRIRVEY